MIIPRTTKNPGPEKTIRILVVVLGLFCCVMPVGAGDVTLSVPVSEFYVIVGEEAVIPLTIVSSYDHDITGTLRQVMIPVSAGTDRSGAGNVRSREFAAFTEERTVQVAVGRSDVPADYILTFTFSYPEGEGRISTLGGITVHYIASMEDARPTDGTLTGTDIAAPSPASSGSSGTNNAGQAKNPDNTPAGTTKQQPEPLQLNQNTSVLEALMSEEKNVREKNASALAAYVIADPIIRSINTSLAGAGYFLETTKTTPVSDRSGTFLLTYGSETKNVLVRGSVLETRVLFAEESSKTPFPLPTALQENTTFRQYKERLAGRGFVRDESRINITPDLATADLTFSGSRAIPLRLHAEIRNGTVIDIAGDDPDGFPVPAGQVAALAGAILICAGIWYFARHRPPVTVAVTEFCEICPMPVNPADAIVQLLSEAEQDAAGGSLPEAYRKTGRAIRIILAQRIGSRNELTNRDIDRNLGSCWGKAEKIRRALDRSSSVGFAKDLPEAHEVREMIGFARHLLDEYPYPMRSSDPDAGNAKEP
ncbi:MAG: hypothetical protein M0Q92_07685 [Methanoregula sp.]|jgi:hypothetical protein|nr:hypothetical protein [Methanoregula sp.]